MNDLHMMVHLDIHLLSKVYACMSIVSLLPQDGE